MPSLSRSSLPPQGQFSRYHRASSQELICEHVNRGWQDQLCASTVGQVVIRKKGLPVVEEALPGSIVCSPRCDELLTGKSDRAVTKPITNFLIVPLPHAFRNGLTHSSSHPKLLSFRSSPACGQGFVFRAKPPFAF
jgi:hypothetical protein